MTHSNASPLRRGARAFLLALAALAALAVAGCGRNVDLELLGGPVPVYGGSDPSVAQIVVAGGQRSQTLTVPDNAPSVTEKYVKWFTKNGWNRVSQTADVNAATHILGRGDMQAIITYQAGRGTSVRITAPENR